MLILVHHEHATKTVYICIGNASIPSLSHTITIICFCIWHAKFFFKSGVEICSYCSLLCLQAEFKGFTTIALCPFPADTGSFAKCFLGLLNRYGYKGTFIWICNSTLSTRKAQKVILILGQTTMGAESLLQIQNNYSKNVTFAKLITYMEYGFYRREYHAATWRSLFSKACALDGTEPQNDDFCALYYNLATLFSSHMTKKKSKNNKTRRCFSNGWIDFSYSQNE